jgi:uncharacterized protein (TIGR03083 family)
MDDTLRALRSSVGRLHELVHGLDDDQLNRPSYASEWSIADTLSHLGSGAVIMRNRLAQVLSDAAADDDPALVWDEWNAKTPRRQADDALVADAQLLEAFEDVDLADRQRVTFAMGPMTLNFADYTGARLSEHALHTWDIEVMRDPSALLPSDATAIVVDRLGLIATFASRPTGDDRRVQIHTSDPERDFTVTLTPDAVTMDEARGDGGGAGKDLAMPAEAFVRLVYGRLDPQHTPEMDGDVAALDTLRAVFPGP